MPARGHRRVADDVRESSARDAPVDRRALIDRYRRVRDATRALCEPLSPEDMVVQVALHASPTKWHIAHTTWFFETFVVEPESRGYRAYDDAFRVLFNSYYQQIGERHPRARRGLLTRPGIGEVLAYRDTIDERLVHLLETADDAAVARMEPLIELGLHHEQQHQELLVTDVMLLLSENPVQPSYFVDPAAGRERGAEHAVNGAASLEWIAIDGGVVEVGHDPMPGSFAYDNESPAHRVFLEPFELASRLVTNREFAAFVDEGGYESAVLWLDEGWACVQAEGWTMPRHWRREGDGWFSEFSLRGRHAIDPERPVSQLSFFEAEAFARWSGARLPTEFEWEHAARPHWKSAIAEGRLLDLAELRPRPADPARNGLQQLAGDVWEWTRSSYDPYPGYAPVAGAVGEYNGKFMCNQYVLRGGSCLTSSDHVRVTYRNFFPPELRWQFAGIRLARSGPTRTERSAG